MLIKDVMTKDIEIIHPDISVKDAAVKMRTLDVGFLPAGENDKLVGMITDRDVTTRAVADALEPETTKVRDIMTEDVKYVFEEDSIEKAANDMKENQVRRLIVLNNDKRAVGIISLGDIAVAANENLTGDILEKVSEPAEPNL